MKRNSSLMLSAAAMMVAGLLSFPMNARAQQSTKTMYVVGRGTVQVVRLYDKPDPLGTTMKSLPSGSPIEVYTDQLYNKYWYKTSEGYYAHTLYLSDTDPNAEPGAAEGPKTSEEQKREADLLEKYKDLDVVNNILVGNVKPGMTMSMVADSWGQPDDKRLLQGNAAGDEWLWIYDNAKHRADVQFDYRQRVAEVRIRP